MFIRQPKLAVAKGCDDEKACAESKDKVMEASPLCHCRCNDRSSPILVSVALYRGILGQLQQN